MNNSKTWSILCIALVMVLLIAAGSATMIIDPFFHFHAPLENLEYPIDNQRYQNDGIVRNFEYDAIITGSSMTENFKTTEFDALFGVNSVKVSYSGGSYAELFSNLQQAMESNPNIRTVIFCIDEWFLFTGRELISADGAYPTYLYDDNIFNDVEYVLNKEILCDNTLGVLEYTRDGKTTTSFDEYGSWEFPTGTDVVLANYQRLEKAQTISLTDADISLMKDTLENAALKLALEYPDTQFLYYFPPYSILNWDNNNQIGILERQVEAMQLASHILLQADNIQLFSFFTDYETITNLDNYRDIVHHSSEINSLLLQRMCKGEYRLTKETIDSHWQEVLNYYSNFDYEALFTE